MPCTLGNKAKKYHEYFGGLHSCHFFRCCEKNYEVKMQRQKHFFIGSKKREKNNIVFASKFVKLACFFTTGEHILKCITKLKCIITRPILYPR